MQRIRIICLNYWEIGLFYPALFFFLFSTDINQVAQFGLVYRKTCLAKFNESVCNAIHSNFNASFQMKASIYVQESASQVQIILNVAFIAPAIVSLIHLSGIADRNLNYELPLIVSLIGSIFQSFVCIFAVKVPFLLFYYLLIISQFINGACGAGSLTFISSCFSHLTVFDKKSNIQVFQSFFKFLKLFFYFNTFI